MSNLYFFYLNYLFFFFLHFLHDILLSLFIILRLEVPASFSFDFFESLIFWKSGILTSLCFFLFFFFLISVLPKIQFLILYESNHFFTSGLCVKLYIITWIICLLLYYFYSLAHLSVKIVFYDFKKYFDLSGMLIAHKNVLLKFVVCVT